MGNALSAGTPNAPFIALAAGLALLQAASASSGGGLAGAIAMLQQSVRINVAALLALALALVVYVAHTIAPSRLRVYVLDFAVHTPHAR
jgi:hypothetical protein